MPQIAQYVVTPQQKEAIHDVTQQIYTIASYSIGGMLLTLSMIALITYLTNKDKGIEKFLLLIAGAIIFSIIPSIINLFV